MRLKVTKNWGRALLNFFKIKVAAKEAILNWTSDQMILRRAWMRRWELDASSPARSEGIWSW
jgi:hypothetical protein